MWTDQLSCFCFVIGGSACLCLQCHHGVGDDGWELQALSFLCSTSFTGLYGKLDLTVEVWAYFRQGMTLGWGCSHLMLSPVVAPWPSLSSWPLSAHAGSQARATTWHGTLLQERVGGWWLCAHHSCHPCGHLYVSHVKCCPGCHFSRAV